MTLLRASMFCSVVALASCGTAKKSSDAPAANAPKISEDQAKADAATLPGIVIVRVPIDANGKEVQDKAEMRLVDGKESLTESNIATTFDAGKAPQATSELDQTSSTESFCGWAFGAGFRNRYYGNSYAWNWQFYSPVYLNYGYSYGYNYGGSYGGIGYGNGYGNGYGAGYGSSNYYYYNQGFNHGYSNQGWNPGMSYNGGMY